MTTLRAFLRRADIYRRYMPAHCGTWTEGSCLRLATAFCHWAQLSGSCGQYGAMTLGGWRIEHVVYSMDGGAHVLDGEGVSTRAAFLRRQRRLYAWPQEFVFPIEANRLLNADGILRGGKDMQRLGQELFESLGPIQGAR